MRTSTSPVRSGASSAGLRRSPVRSPEASATRPTAARRLLEQPAVQKAFVNAPAAAQRQFIAVPATTPRTRRSGDRVVLDLRPLLLQLGDRFDRPNLDARVSADAGRLTSSTNELSDAQQAVRRAVHANRIGCSPSRPRPRSGSRGHRHRGPRVAIGLVIAGFSSDRAHPRDVRSWTTFPDGVGRLATAAA